MDPPSRRPVPLAIALGLLVLLTPGAHALAEPLYAPVLDDRLDALDQRLMRAQATHGERPEFNQAGQRIGSVHAALQENATLLATDEMATAAAALELGRIRALAAGHEDRDQAVRAEADRLAHQARRGIEAVRTALDNATDAGMTAGELDRAVLVGYMVLSAHDRLQVHQRARDSWMAGNRAESTERALVGGAAGSAVLADIAIESWRNASTASQATSGGPVLKRPAISELALARAAHVADGPPGDAQAGRERVGQLARDGEPVLALAAFLLWTQGIALEEGRASSEQGAAQRLIDEEGPKVDGWLEEIGVRGELARGALASARVVLGDNATQADNVYAASLAMLAVEHVGLLVDGYAGVEREPGTSLADPPGQSWWWPWRWHLAVAGLGVSVALVGWRMWRRGQER